MLTNPFPPAAATGAGVAGRSVTVKMRALIATSRARRAAMRGNGLAPAIGADENGPTVPIPPACRDRSIGPVLVTRSVPKQP
jgi:hypothetical protein